MDHTLSKRRRTVRRGNYTILMGVLVWGVVGFAAFSVDIALITMAELQAQATADAASHAALVAFREDLSVADGNQAANFIVGIDEVAMGNAVIEPGYPQYGQYDFNLRTFSQGLNASGAANAVRVRVSRKASNSVDLLLAPLYPIGVSNHDVEAEAITAQQMRAIEVVVDMSCSMMPYNATTGKWIDEEISPVNLSRQANQVFLDYLVDHAQDGDMLGLSLFAQRAATAPSSSDNDGGGSYLGDSVPWQPLVFVESSVDLLKDRIDGICDTAESSQSSWEYCPAGWHPTTSTIGQYTNPEPALKQAIYQLTTKTDSTYFRGIVFFSDGLPNPQFGTPEDAQAAAYAQANAANAEDISIWTITFHNGPFDTTFMENMTRGSGFAQVSPDAADLPAMYEEVARSLPTALVE